MDYRFLKDKEQFTIDNAYNGYTKPATTLNIWIENKPNSVENRIVYKKESSKNHEKSTYGLTWLIEVEGILYRVDINPYRQDVNISCMYARFNSNVTPLDPIEQEELKQDILTTDNAVSKYLSLYKKAQERYNQAKKEYETKVSENTDKEIKDIILDINSYDNYKASKKST